MKTAASYKPLQLIKKSSSTAVYRGVEWGSQKPVAIKLFESAPHSELSCDREIRLFEELEHPNLPECMGWCNAEEGVYLILEYCPLSLGQYVKANPEYPMSLVKKWLSQLLDVLQYLWEKRVVHGNITIDNILLTEDLDVKLINFGNARKIPDYEAITATQSMHSCVAPEVYHSYCTAASDVWSFGVVAYSLFFRELPFKMKRSTIDYTLNIPSNTPLEVKELLSGVFKPHPAHRPTPVQLQHYRFFQTDFLDLNPQRSLSHAEVQLLDSRRVELEEAEELVRYYSAQNKIAGFALQWYRYREFKGLFVLLEQMKTRFNIQYLTAELQFANLYELVQRDFVAALAEYETNLKTQRDGLLYSDLANNLVKVLRVTIRKEGMIKHMKGHVKFVIAAVLSLDPTNAEGLRINCHFDRVTAMNT